MEQKVYKGEKRNVILDPYDQLTSATRTNGPNGAADAAYDFGYQYDEVGNRLHEDRKDFDLDGTFNVLNQLTERDWGGRLPVYGNVGDTNAVIIVGGVTSAPPYFNSTNWLGGGAVDSAGSNSIPIVANVGTNSTQTNLTVYMPPEKPQEFLWDANGNLTNDGCRIYSWTEENRLVEIEHTAAYQGARKKSSFTYDGMGRRAKRLDYSSWNGSVYTVTNETRFVWDGWNLLAELDANNQITTYNVWGLDLSQSLQGAGGIGGLLATRNASDTHLYFFDGNGNVTDVTDDTGSLKAHYEYDPFGSAFSQSGPYAPTNKWRFSTKQFEDDWGLSYYGRRYYSADTGRWLSRDPLGKRGGVGLYAFVENAPILTVDVLGLAPPGAVADPPLVPPPRHGFKHFHVQCDCNEKEVIDKEIHTLRMRWNIPFLALDVFTSCVNAGGSPPECSDLIKPDDTVLWMIVWRYKCVPLEAIQVPPPKLSRASHEVITKRWWTLWIYETYTHVYVFQRRTP